MLALNANKHVLCEKAFTVNAAQAKILCETAQKKKLFLMEAVWTRYFPLSIKIRSMIENGEIGTLHRVIADNSFGEDIEKHWGTKHRMVNPDLAGGALLDLGIYSLTWLFQTMYLTQQAPQTPKVLGSITKYAATGADESTNMIVTFPRKAEEGGDAQGIALTNLRVATDPDQKASAGPGIKIQGSKAEIQIFGPAFRPTGFQVIYKKGQTPAKPWEKDASGGASSGCVV